MSEVPKDLAKALIRRARARAPREACGLVVRRRGQAAPRAIALPNRAADRRRAFELDAGRVVGFLECPEWTVEGVWHSHPDGPPLLSRADGGAFLAGGYQLVVGRDVHGGWICRRFDDRGAPSGSGGEA